VSVCTNLIIRYKKDQN